MRLADLLLAAAFLPLAACSSAAGDDLAACQSFDDAQAAASACTRVIESPSTSKPNLATAYLYRGLAQQGLGNGERAIKDLDAAVRISPSNSLILANRGATHSQQNNLDAGWKDIEAALKIDPSNVLAIGNRAIILERRGEFLAARVDIDRALAIDSTPYQLWGERCWIGAVLADEFPRTVEDCNKAIQIFPDDPNHFNSRGLVHFRMGNHALAIADYDRSIQGNPGVASSFLMRGLAKRAAGDTAGGASDMAKGRQMDPDVASRYAGYGVKVD